MQSSRKGGARKWLVIGAWILGLGLVGAGVTWQFFRILPTWIEDAVGNKLLDKGVVLTKFPVQGIGWEQSHVGPGGLVFESHALTWDGIWIDYRFNDLMEGRVGSVLLDGPIFTIDLSQFSQTVAGSLPGEDYLTPERVHLDPDEPSPLAEGEHNRLPAAVTGQPEKQIPVIEQDSAREIEPLEVWKTLQDLSLGAFHIPNGLVNISFHEERLMRFSLETELVKEPFGVSAEISFRNAQLSSHYSLRAPVAKPVVTVQGKLAMPKEGLALSISQFAPVLESIGSVPAVVSTGPLNMDFLVELDDLDQPQGSVEIELAELILRPPESDLVVSLNQVLVGGSYKDGRLKLESGAEILLPNGADYTVDPFGLRFSLDSSTGFEVETETFGWNYSGMRGKAALRGSGSITGVPSRAEIAFSEIVGDWISLEPFSMLMEAGQDAYKLKASAIGARKMDTIWIEELEAEVSTGMESGNGSMTWYNAVGVHMGAVEGSFSRSDDDMRLALSLKEPGKSPFLTGELHQEGDTASLRAAGDLLFSWVNSLTAWWGGIPAKFGGKDPVIEAELRGIHPFYSGKASMELVDTWVELEGDTRLEGIRGSVNLSILGLPMIPEMQELRIAKVSSGQIVMEDVLLEWSMPTIRRFEMKHFEAKISQGSISLDPFTLDPMKPVLQTQIHVQHLEGNKLLEWLGERRFSVEGSVSGRLALGWKDGDIILGDGILELDSSEHDGRFIFEDPSFLKDQFDSFSGIQKDLKERFLSALLEEGIEIHSMQISLGAAPEQGKILLRMAVSGQTRNELLEVPIKGFIINNVISGEDLGHLMGLIGPVRIRTDASDRN